MKFTVGLPFLYGAAALMLMPSTLPVKDASLSMMSPFATVDAHRFNTLRKDRLVGADPRTWSPFDKHGRRIVHDTIDVEETAAATEEMTLSGLQQDWPIPLPGGKKVTPFKALKEIEAGELILAEIERPGNYEWRYVKDLTASHTKYMDVTQTYRRDKSLFDGESVPRRYPLPASLSQSSEVERISGLVKEENMRTFLDHFTNSYKTRYFKSSTGVEAAEWLYTHLESMIAATAHKGVHVQLEKFEHDDWPQMSIIARVMGSRSEANPERVILGSHLDSVSSVWRTFKAPGADDDGSGTAVVLESFRAFLESGHVPERNIEWHFYSGEEAGLKGSQDVAANYARRGVPVMAMMQFDMVGWTDESTTMGIIRDFTDPATTDFATKLIDAYTSKYVNRVDSSCGYACSDHGSWMKHGYPAAFVFETDFKDHSPYIHTAKDTVENLHFDWMMEFTKIATGFAVELGHIESRHASISEPVEEDDEAFDEFSSYF